MNKKKGTRVPTSRVIVDCRNAAADRLVPTGTAKLLYEEGVLVRDVTNNAYAVPHNGVLPCILMDYPRAK